MSDYLTVGQISELFGMPVWKIRRAVDSLPGEIPRAAGNRMVPRSRLGELAIELQRRGWLGETSGQSRNDRLAVAGG